jgi:TolB-like protein/Flp pilus assembly protein TadD
VSSERRNRQVYEFGPFRLDAAERTLMRDGTPVRQAGGGGAMLTPKVVETLVALVERSGQIVGKDELMRAVWPDAVVEEGNLAANISLLRKALGAAEDGRPYIETFPKRGYRFSAAVELVEADATKFVVRRRTRARIITTEEESADDPLMGVAERAALAAGTSERRTLAVLPFRVLSVAAGEEFLGLGLADALITQLGNTGRIVVRPTSAVRRYAEEAERDSVSVGRELGVDAVLEGSVQHAGARLRVTVQMLGVLDGVPLWADKFNAPFTDIFDVQDSIAEQVARALTLRLTGENRERLRKRYTESADAYRDYLRGRYFVNKRTVEGFRKAVAHFERAIEVDPAFALAFAGLSDAQALLAVWGEESPRTCFPRARAAAERALEIDDELPEAHTALGYVLYFYEWDFRGAEREFLRAIKLNPSYAAAHNRYAQMLVSLERFAEAEAEMKAALELDPLSPMVNTAFGGPALYSRQYDAAIEHYRKVLELEPDFVPALFALSVALTQTGRHDESIATARHAAGVSGRHPIIVALLATACAAAGWREEAERLLEELLTGERRTPSYSLATVYARLGDAEGALACLERAFEEHVSHVADLNIEPEFDPIRADPRFRKLVRRVGLDTRLSFNT